MSEERSHNMMEQADCQELERKEGDESAKEQERRTEDTYSNEPPEDERPQRQGLTTEVAEVAETQANLPEITEQPAALQSCSEIGTSTATVKVVLVPEGHVMTVAFAIGLSIQELKLHLASELRVPPEVLRIAIDGQVVEDQQSLMDLGVLPHGSTRMEMSSVDPNTHPLRPVRPPEHDNMPDVITVRVHRGEESPTSSSDDFWEVVVEIQRPPQRKPFLGGYKHRLTGAVYHHASTQTLHRRRPDRGVEVFSRGAQTVKQAQPCGSDVRTQMTGMGSYVSCANDKVLIPGRYTTAAEYYDRRLKAVIRLQAVVRGWLAKEAVGLLRQDRDRRLAWLDLQERRSKQEKEEQLEDRRRRWLNPQRREDFSLHYNALKKWHKDEELKINAKLKGAERKAALCALFDQELEHIKNLGYRQILFGETNEDRCMRNLLEKAAAPHHWRSAKGERIEMDTANTIRARELRDLYDDVSKTTANQNERLQILMTLKHTVNEQDCPLTRDIVDLVDREVDLMPRLKTSSLTGLRERIAMLFLQYVKTPAFNPAVAKLLKVPPDASQLKNHQRCSSCHRLLPTTSFKTTAGCPNSHRCKDCDRLTNIAIERNDLSCYKNILKRLRADEQQLDKNALIPFIMQVEDIRCLIDVIWSKCSALMTCNDIYNLVLVRWDHLKNWSPWNCLLLAKEEVSTHLQIKDVEQAYAPEFVRRIKLRHLTARQHFSQMPALVELMDREQKTALDNKLAFQAPIATATGQRATHSVASSSH